VRFRGEPQLVALNCRSCELHLVEDVQDHPSGAPGCWFRHRPHANCSIRPSRNVLLLLGRRVTRLFERLWLDAEQAYRAKLLEKVRPERTARLLDVGCDDGEWTEAVRGRLGVPPEQVYGLEIVDERAALARARGFDVRGGDIESAWPFAASSIDVVHSNQVIEHVKRLDHFVQETRRVLVPRGIAVVCTENLASWHNIAALVAGYQPFSSTNISDIRRIGNPFALHAEESPGAESWQHVHVVTLTALRDIFAAHGFTIESAWGAGYHPLMGRAAARAAALDPRHAHFIGVVARAPA
jgi:SAM-dependent methyltransferase